MLYAKVKGKEILEYPLTLEEVKSRHQNISFPDGENNFPNLTHLGYVQVNEKTLPEVSSKKKKIELGTPIWENNKLVRTYKIIDLTEEEIQSSYKDLTNYNASHRLVVENKGTYVDKIFVATDRESQSRYQSELLAISLNVRNNEYWKMPGGTFEIISNSQMRKMAIAAREFVKNCFKIEGLILEEILNDKIDTFQEIRDRYEKYLIDAQNNDLPQTREELSNAINRERAERFLLGCVVEMNDGKKIAIQGDEETTRNMSALFNAALMRTSSGAGDHITVYRDANNVDHELTQAQIQELWAKSAAYGESLYPASWELKKMTTIPKDYSSSKYWPDNGIEKTEEV